MTSVPALGAFRALDGPLKLLLVTNLGFNASFYMVIPMLAGHLEGQGLTASVIGLILGLRSASQQGLFLVGGLVGDRLDPRGVILAGCVLRCLGFCLLGASGSAAGFISGSILSGVGAALFTPAMKAFVGRARASQRASAFALAETLQQVGALLGPLLGLALMGFGYPRVAMASGLSFLVWGLILFRWLPAPTGDHLGRGVVASLRHPLGNPTFLRLAAAMAGYSVLFNQFYLALPLTLRAAAGHDAHGALIFAVSGGCVIVLQVRVTEFCRIRLGADLSIRAGLATMAAAFGGLALLQLVAPTPQAPMVEIGAVYATVGILTVGMMMCLPTVMARVTELAPPDLLGTYFGVLYMGWGVAGTLGNMAVGRMIERGHGGFWLWVALCGLGLLAAALVDGRSSAKS